MTTGSHVDRGAIDTLTVDVTEHLDSNITVRTIILSRDGRTEHEIFFECRGVCLPPLRTFDFAVLAVLFHAMRFRRALHINGPVSETLLRNLEEFQEAWTLWRPVYRPIKITAETEIPDFPVAERSGVFAFSGGVDGTFAMLRHLNGDSGRRTCKPTVAMLVHGFDIPLKDAEAFSTAESSSRQMLNQLNIPLAVIRTNWKKDICYDWECEFGAGIAACLHQFAGLASFGVLGADEDYAHLELPWGSNPATNHLLSGGNFGLYTEGAGFTRTQRVQLIARYPEIAKRLRVCWAGPITGKNCGFCEKCVRTKLNFLAVEAETSCFEGPPTHLQILGIKAPLPIQIAYMSDILSFARSRQIKAAWVWSLRLAIAKNKALHWLRKASYRMRSRIGSAGICC